MGAARGGELVELGFAARLGRLPCGFEQLLVFEAVKRGIERSLLDLQGLAGHLLNSLGDGVAVNGAERDHPHDEEVEGSLREIESVCGFHAYTFYLYLYTPTCRRSRYSEYGVFWGMGSEVSEFWD